ncbi:MAG: CTP synthase [Proteobacteria bacterium]|nr:CTP synthase [Pseudomonadota bacterium]
MFSNLPKFIFITGGVVSSLGKGIAAASLGVLLQEHGFKVRIRKLDPYLNLDPGTMSPYQHGEVFVTEDGAETDLDLGHYERFTNINATKNDNTTAGKIYSSVFAKERRGDYLGKTIQVVPHIIDEIKSFITSHLDFEDFVIYEIGGTVGDIEGLPFIEAIRQLRHDLGMERTLFIHVTLLPYIDVAQEIKTKPTQHSVKELLSLGIQPDILLCRTNRPITLDIKNKLGLFCNVKTERVIAAYDVKNIYEVPLIYHQEGLDDQVCQYFKTSPQTKTFLKNWDNLLHIIQNPKKVVKVGIVGKYTQLPDAYKSLLEALAHGGIAHHVKVDLELISADQENDEFLKELDGIVVPGGFGPRGIEGKLKAIQFAREKNVPFLGICLGMQLSIIEVARNLLNLEDASSTEFGPTPHPVIGLMREWLENGTKIHRSPQHDLGGTMRLGKYPCRLLPGSKAFAAYQTNEISERHRHRYEVNLHYKEKLEKAGLCFSGMSPDGTLTEIVEYKNHPWFIAVQFHPELKSRPFTPHPLFKAFIGAILAQKIT